MDYKQHLVFNPMYAQLKLALNILKLSKDGKTYEGGSTCTQ